MTILRYGYNVYNFTNSDGQNYNLLDLAVGAQKLPLFDRLRLFVKTKANCATEEEGDAKSLYDAIEKINGAASEIFALCQAHDHTFPNARLSQSSVEGTEVMVKNHPIFKKARDQLAEGLDELQGLEYTIEKSNFSKVTPDALLKDISQVAYNKLDKS
jgi:hypothetical protein